MNETMMKKDGISYVKPAILDLGPAVVVHGAPCDLTGNNAVITCGPGTGGGGDCWNGTSAQQRCNPNGSSPRNET